MRSLPATPFNQGEPQTFTTLLCDGYRVDNTPSLRALLELMREKAPLHPGARGLTDDGAVVDAGALFVTTDSLVEGVHYLASDPPGDVAWKLVATNLSDLAAKGAGVEGVLLNYPIGDDAWDRAFLAGFGDAMRAMGARLIGGDTVSLRGARTLTLTALGSDAAAPVRSGARAGDASTREPPGTNDGHRPRSFVNGPGRAAARRGGQEFHGICPVAVSTAVLGFGGASGGAPAPPGAR